MPSHPRVQSKDPHRGREGHAIGESSPRPASMSSFNVGQNKNFFDPGQFESHPGISSVSHGFCPDPVGITMQGLPVFLSKNHRYSSSMARC